MRNKYFDSNLFSGYTQTKAGIVYLICDAANNTFKIGVTRDIKSNRLKKLQTGNSTELFISAIYECDYPFRLEKMLHSHYGHAKVINEWFELTAEEVGNFKNTCQELDNKIQLLLSNPFFSQNLH